MSENISTRCPECDERIVVALENGEFKGISDEESWIVRDWE